jgi:hypothetical protein
VTADQALTHLYRQAAARLRVQITAAMRSGRLGTAAYLHQQLTAVQRELRRLHLRTRPYSQAAALDAYRRGLLLAERGGSLRGVFAGVHEHAVAEIARNMDEALNHAAATVGRRAEDALRRIGVEETGIGIAGGQARRQVSKAIEDRLVREGVTDALTGFVDSAGKRWALDVYASMVARTNTRQAVSHGTANRLREQGNPLITISDHGPTDELCARYAGNTYSLVEDDPDYEYLDEGEYPPFHPNCMHYMTPAGENLARLERRLGL